jgi:receptor protein-tyrosine kinase
MDNILDVLREEADIVIVDGPPFLVTDASILSGKTDGVLLVIRYGHTLKEAATNSVRQLQRTGARILGVVLNQIPRKSLDYGGIYHYYAGYYADREEGEEPPQESERARVPGFFSRQPKNPPAQK